MVLSMTMGNGYGLCGVGWLVGWLLRSRGMKNEMKNEILMRWDDCQMEWE
jgi:hypothetical protein